MRGLFRHATWAVLLLVFHAENAPAQFSAKGRKRSPPPAGSNAPAKPTTRTKAAQPAGEPVNAAPSEATSAADSPAARRELLILRYEQLLEKEPGDPSALLRLIELVRERDGDLRQLEDHLRTRVEQGGTTGYAATMALAGLAEAEGRTQDAQALLDDAHQQLPDRPEALLARARLEQARGDLLAATQSLLKALPHTTGLDQQSTLRSLRDLSLDLGRLSEAQGYHRQLTAGDRGNGYLLGELARELLRRGRIEDAIAENERLVRGAAGDNRALAPALRDLGEAQVAGGQYNEAKVSLARASRLSIRQPGLRLQIDELLAEAHRGAGTLDVFLEELQTTATSTDRLMLLGQLRERQGETAKAILAYRLAAQKSPKDADPLVALIRLLELTSELSDAATQYGKLTRLAPDQVDLSLRYIELLLAQGRRPEALAELDRMARTASRDPDAALLLLDLAERLGERERALALRTTLETRGALEAHHLVELGSRAYRDGEHDRANALWKRILSVRGRPEDLQVVYGETLLAHEDTSAGVQALKTAVELAPDSPRTRRALARGLLRAAAQSSGTTKTDYELASLEIWSGLVRAGGTEPADAKNREEARRQVVRLYQRTSQLDAQISRLHRRYEEGPEDLELGRLLTLAQLQRSRPNEAEWTLRKMLKVAPADRETLQLLQQVQLDQGKVKESLRTLEMLVALDPTHAPQTYEELSRRALLLHDDRLALKYAERSLERDNGSAEAHARLGDLYAAQGHPERAVEAYRAALAKNDRMNHVALTLAGLLTKQGQEQNALELLLRVLRSSSNDHELTEAGRLALTIGLYTGQARRLEDELRPLAISMPERAPYQSLLLEVLTAELTPLLWNAEFGEAPQRKEATEELTALADRCLSPLLLALGKGNPGQEQQAIAILAHGSSESAGAALLEYASGAAPEGLRVQAVLAAGRHTDTRLTPRLASLVAAGGVPLRGRLARAALISLGAIRTEESRRAVRLALDSNDPDLRVEAILALADAPSALSQEELLAIVNRRSAGESPRAAAALALAERKASDAVTRQLLIAANDEHRLVRAAALHAIERLTPGSRQVAELATRALFESDRELSEAAQSTLTMQRRPTAAAQPTPPVGRLDASQLQLPSSQLLWQRLLTHPTAAARAQALVAHEEALQASAQLGLLTSKGSALQVLDALRPWGEVVGFAPLFDAERDTPLLPASLLAAAQAASRRIHDALLPGIISHAEGADATARAAALRTLTLDEGPEAKVAIESGLRSEDPTVFEAALDALSRSAAEGAVMTLGELLGHERRWHRTRRIAEVLERLAQRTTGTQRADARSLLSQIASESDGLARSRAEEALHTLDSKQGPAGSPPR